MILIPNLNDDLFRLDYYIKNSSSGFIVWECNETVSKHEIKNILIKKHNAVFFDLSFVKRKTYIEKLKKNPKDQKRPDVYVFENFDDIISPINELNFTRDILASYDNIYIFIFPTYFVTEVMIRSPSFWSYVSVHFKIQNIFFNPMSFEKRLPVQGTYTYEYDRLVNNAIDCYFNNENDNAYALMNQAGGLLDANDRELLLSHYYNMSRFFGIDKKSAESLEYAKKCAELTGLDSDYGQKMYLNLLFCESIIGYKHPDKNLSLYQKQFEIADDLFAGAYYAALRRLTSGLFKDANDIVLKALYELQKTSGDKYYYLFVELAAVINYYLVNAELAVRYLKKLLSVDGDTLKANFIDTGVLKNNIDLLICKLTEEEK